MKVIDFATKKPRSIYYFMILKTMNFLQVDCINEEDCKEEQFCDSLSYACKDCLKINETCHKHKQCCKGFLCREGKCEAITGGCYIPSLRMGILGHFHKI